MEATDKPVINIYTESNPNPNSLKFVLNFMLLPEGVSRDFPDKASTTEAPLASELFNYPYVKRVFYMSNFVTVTKDDATDWYEVKTDIQNHIKKFLEDGRQILTEKEVQEDHKVSDDDSDVEVKIKGILDEYIRPAVEMDGGAISFGSYDDGVVKVILQGSCSGCPSSTVTLKAGIETLLKKMVPEVQEVVAEGV
ncbi:NifU family protein [Marinoscillum sp. MHG1-6]|uniref:NifU family protein n=1 Tax=Marinoscillum sp. MHG1-6 TaxID=2959627 RepID=UPI00215839F2|nr:NifU family protein [Marinoscillum sp. MHG1-6]